MKWQLDEYQDILIRLRGKHLCWDTVPRLWMFSRKKRKTFESKTIQIWRSEWARFVTWTTGFMNQLVVSCRQVTFWLHGKRSRERSEPPPGTGNGQIKLPQNYGKNWTGIAPFRIWRIWECSICTVTCLSLYNTIHFQMNSRVSNNPELISFDFRGSSFLRRFSIQRLVLVPSQTKLEDPELFWLVSMPPVHEAQHLVPLYMVGGTFSYNQLGCIIQNSSAQGRKRGVTCKRESSQIFPI